MSLEINGIGSVSSQQSKTEVSSPTKVSDGFLFDPSKNRSQTPKVDMAKVLTQLKTMGYQVEDWGDGTYILTDQLNHKTRVNGFSYDNNGNLTWCNLHVQIVDPAQKNRVFGEMTDEQKAQNEAACKEILKNAGYTLEAQDGGRYILTNPDGKESLVNNLGLGLDGGATWTVLPVHLNSDNNITEFTYE